MSDCIFCRIVRKEIPAKILYEDEHCLAFHDVAPKAPVHLLLIPKVHLDSLLAVTPDHAQLLGHLTTRIPHIAQLSGLEEGFQTRIHTGKKGGQEVFHLHYHLLGSGH